jgi:hypothetical protein
VPPSDCSFVALTYVWGGTDQVKLSRETTTTLSRNGGLDEFWSGLSTTLRDAILVCAKLHERYLWTDSLCIMQDSSRDMKLQILRMRYIYAAAKCTIAAVSAENADSGLLGITTTRASVFKSQDELAALVKASPWSTRAWCYQEKVLSHRLILFTSHGIYLQCQQGSYTTMGCKLSSGPTPTLNEYNSCGSLLSIRPGEEMNSFLFSVQHYSQRNVTHPQDKMNAFNGITQRYTGGMDGDWASTLYGLPICAFDQAFCWRTSKHEPSKRNRHFPSWSWMGWDNVVSFDWQMLNEARTKQMLYNGFETEKPKSNDRQRLSQVRKPISKEDTFGFPSAFAGGYRNSQEQTFRASVARLLIAPEAEELEGSNGLFSVYSTCCSQKRPPTPPKRVTVSEMLDRPLPSIKFLDAGTMAYPSVPTVKQAIEDYDVTQHKSHTDCEARSQLGAIWLDVDWRKQQPLICVMDFVALAGAKNKERPGQWIITLLMLVHCMEKNGHVWARERVQIMDCNIEQSYWLRVRGKAEMIKLV